MTTYVHVNRNIINSNTKHGTTHPAVRIQTGRYGDPTLCSEAVIYGQDGKEAARLIYSPHKPLLPCGARLVIKTENKVEAIG